nr:asparagine synthase (glutamine-hydrolyzing) [Caulobacter mirabilis]
MSLVQAIAEAQTARGPDALVVERFQAGDAEVVLGHNRLSIIDLSVEANQPMNDASGRFTIVFNGEIYNYLELRKQLEADGVQFHTASDTEVLIEAYRAWGKAALEKFYGMFAFALLDRLEGELLLVRDRFGVKPLYYWTDGATLAFASTTGTIARWAGLEPNLAYVARGLRFKYYEDETDISPHKGLKALEGGTWLAVKLRGDRLALEQGRYYDVADRVQAERAKIEGLSFQELEARLLSLLDDASSIRLRADVPVGVSLSGGVDSTTIAAITARKHPRIVGYSFAHPDVPESEGPLVKELVDATGVQPRYVWPTAPAEIEDLFWRTYRAQEAPFPHASMMAQNAVFRAARQDGVKVLLGGQAGDEAFMGYRKFYLFYAQSILRQKRWGEGPHLALAMAPFALAIAKRAGVFWSERARYAQGGTGMASRLRLPAEVEASGAGMSAGQTPLDRQVLDITRYSLPSLLRYEDRNSLSNSVESRLPFIDHRVVEFGLALQERHKLANGFGKWILRSAIKDLVPDSIRLNRDKRGFDVNQARWIEGGLGRVLREALTERRKQIVDYLPSDANLEALFSDAALISDPQAFKEAVSLIWLGDQA